MGEIPRGTIFRNVHGAYVVVDGVGPYEVDGQQGTALWVDVCDEHGAVTGGRIPMEPDGFPGPLWTLVGAVTS